MSKFKYAISLGYFCSTALEFRRINVRDASYPFDWVISYDFEAMLYLIENNFAEFLSSELLYQLKEVPNCYRNRRYKIDFYHDFDEFKSLRRQLKKVQEKYNRRIKRFYDTIKSPTLLIRYVSSAKELLYIQENYEKIQTIFRKFNSKNEVHFVVNSDLYNEENLDFNFWYVEKDENENVARVFLEKNEKLKEYILNNVEYRIKNSFKSFQKRYSYALHLYRKIRTKLKLFYRHSQMVNHSDK